MTTTNLPPPAEDDDLLLDAYIDGELDARTALMIERRMESDAILMSAFERLRALRAAVRTHVPRDVASGALRARIAAATVPQMAKPQALGSRVFDWRQMAASVLVAAALASGSTMLALRQDGGGADIGSIVAEHRRALLAASPVDVESSDRHTVKPWFDAKLALSPQVIDLAPAGFPLAGGRVEVVGGKLVPAMIYRRHGHLISVVAVPKPGGRDNGASASSATEDGYSVLSWHGQDFDYFAVSDVAPDELSGFLADWRTAAK